MYEIVATLILLVAVMWPHLSLGNMIKGGLIAGIWAITGFIDYLKLIARSR